MSIKRCLFTFLGLAITASMSTSCGVFEDLYDKINGESNDEDDSKDDSKASPTPIVQLTAPTNLQGNLASNGFSLSWTFDETASFELQRLETNSPVLVPPSESDMPSDWTEAVSIDCDASPCVDGETPLLDLSTKSYWYRVRASNGPWSEKLLVPNVPTAPPVPSLIAGGGGIGVVWSVPEHNNGKAIVDYEIRHKLATETNYPDRPQREDLSPTVRIASIRQLREGSTHHIQIRACNEVRNALCGPWSETASGTVTSSRPPGPSFRLTAEVSGTSVNLSWTPPPDDGGSAILSYKVQWAESASEPSPWAEIAEDNTLSCTDAAATNCTHTLGDDGRGKTYWYRVLAVNNAGNGAPSLARSAEIAATVPSTPTGITFIPTTTQTTVNWAAPSDGGETITSYDVEVVKDPSDTAPTIGWTSVSACGGDVTSTSCTHSGLSGNSKYWYQIRAVNAIGHSEWSTPLATTTLPGQVTGLTHFLAGTSVSLSWSAPNTEGLPLTYAVKYIKKSTAPTQGDTWSDLTCASNADTECAHNLEETDRDSTFWYNVRATNGISDPGAPSTNTRVNIPASSVSAPINVTANVSGTVVSLSWTAPTNLDGGIWEYIVQAHEGTSAPNVWPEPTSDDKVCEGIEDTSCSYDAFNRGGRGKTFWYRVFALNANGHGSAAVTSSAATIPIAKPAAPTNLTSTQGGIKMTLTWDTPFDDGGRDITDYTVQFKRTESGGTIAADWSPLTSCTTSGCIHANLALNDKYRYRVRANNGVTTGDDNWETQTTDTTLSAVVPDPPTGLQLVDSLSGTRVDLTWLAPESNGGSDITDYIVEMVQSNDTDPPGSGWATIFTDPAHTCDDVSTDDSCYVLSLSAGTKYWFRVKAKNSIGTETTGVSESITTSSQ